MENSESGDETYLTGEQQFILNADGDDGLGKQISSSYFIYVTFQVYFSLCTFGSVINTHFRVRFFRKFNLF